MDFFSILTLVGGLAMFLYQVAEKFLNRLPMFFINLQTVRL